MSTVKEARIKTLDEAKAIRSKFVKRRFGRVVSKIGKGFGTKAFNVGTFVLTAKIADMIVEHLRGKAVRANSPIFYAKMLEAHPELKKEDPKLVARYWASLYHFAPYMAQDALAAGSFIRQSLARGLPSEFGGPAPDTYLTLTDIENKLKGKTQGGLFMGEALKATVKELTTPGGFLQTN
jgi:hypothetical protein